MYITRDDYFKFSGIDLDIELKGTVTDNPGKVVQIFIERVEQYCLDYLKLHYFSEGFNEEYFKKGVLHQIDYIRRNSDLSLDYITRLKSIAPNALMQFKLGGMANVVSKKVVSYGDRY